MRARHRGRRVPAARAVAAAFVLVLALVLAACGQLNPTPPVVAFRGVTLRDVALSGATLDVELMIANPNAFNIDVKRVTYRLYADSTLVGTGQPENTVFVLPNDSAIVRLPVQFTFRGLGEVALQLLSRGVVNYRVAGQLEFGTPIGTMTRDFDQTGSFNSAQLR